MHPKSKLRRTIDNLLWRLGYMPKTAAIKGEINFQINEQPFINLTLPSGQRVSGWVDNRLQMVAWTDNPLLEQQ